jgi:hypothetical protein
MFNFSANHLLLLSRMEYRSCSVLLMRDDSTRRVYRLHDFTKSHAPASGQYYCVSGKEWQACHSFPNGKDRIMRRKALEVPKERRR